MDKDQIQNEIENKDENTEAPQSSPYDSTRDVIHRHISNKDDVITDDDIKNAYTGKPVTQIVDDPEHAAAVKRDIERSKAEDKEDDPDDDERLTVPPSNILSD